ncbi:HD-domain/PDEase-like protein [Gonapodya prolifera JEL478]|uniref:Phosphodiesterase n=1 Tax=Gonapodya prolifera (strain JEL478) TaxID=1344416 RepID=A0A139ALM0_GONPJ|nr:HD-domain/PDEase-like protein [Gonapodya prolifera JEL478]|eukprot:KXS17649.1 HD-domain/PDEase-like protein [Gonapodya prolifera JEL478]
MSLSPAGRSRSPGITTEQLSQLHRRSVLLLQIARSLFEFGPEEDKVEALAKKVIRHATHFLSCDRGSLFILDKETNILKSAVFDTAPTTPQEGKFKDHKFSVPLGTGIVGHVAKTGKPLNIPDAYVDPHFNPQIDKATGYTTRSILCVPILNGSTVLGVLNLLNKYEAESPLAAGTSPDFQRASNSESESLSMRTRIYVPFSDSDLDHAEAFAVYCGLALDKALLIDRVIKSEKKLSIVLDIMSYHATASDSDVEAFYDGALPPLGPVSQINFVDGLVHIRSEHGFHWAMESPELGHTIMEIGFDPHAYTDQQLVGANLRMIKDMGFVELYDIDVKSLVRFLLSLAKNYRKPKDVPYHNFRHATAVAHGIFILTMCFNLRRYLTDVEILAMILACMCHDVDHRGTNNQFQRQAKTIFGQFYHNSPMEEHHANHALTILAAQEHRFLTKMASSDYEQLLTIMKRTIIQTDLAIYFKNRSVLESLLKDGSLNIEYDEAHRDLFRGVIMTSVDLTAMYKPFGAAVHIADFVYAEFFMQGDQERKMGLPISANVVDRNNEKEIPKMQRGFFEFIVEPAYVMLSHSIKESLPLLEAVRENKRRWTEWAERGITYKIGGMEEQLKAEGLLPVPSSSGH